MFFSADWKPTWHSAHLIVCTTDNSHERPVFSVCLKNTQYDMSPASAGGSVVLRWWCQRTHHQPPKQIFPFSTRQRDPHARMSVFARQTGFWLPCIELICIWWPFGHAVQTHVSLSCISRLSAALWQQYQWSARRGRIRTEPEPWENRGVKGLEADGSNRILNPVMFFDRDWT